MIYYDISIFLLYQKSTEKIVKVITFATQIINEQNEGIGLSILLKYTKTGKEIYFTGANKRAAWISGININKIKIMAYGISGLTASLAGPLLSSQTNRITPIQGVGFELSAIAVAVG